jgi:hypothetical protein
MVFIKTLKLRRKGDKINGLDDEDVNRGRLPHSRGKKGENMSELFNQYALMVLIFFLVVIFGVFWTMRRRR